MRKVIINKSQLFEAFLNEDIEITNGSAPNAGSAVQTALNSTNQTDGVNSSAEIDGKTGPAITGNKEDAVSGKLAEKAAQIGSGKITIEQPDTIAESKVYTKQQILEMRMKRNGALFTKKELTDYLLNQ